MHPTRRRFLCVSPKSRCPLANSTRTRYEACYAAFAMAITFPPGSATAALLDGLHRYRVSLATHTTANGAATPTRLVDDVIVRRPPTRPRFDTGGALDRWNPVVDTEGRGGKAGVHPVQDKHLHISFGLLLLPKAIKFRELHFNGSKQFSRQSPTMLLRPPVTIVKLIATAAL
jgi:hypothetical protein